MKKYSAKKKRRTCKKGGTTPQIEVSFMNKPIQQLVHGKKYALIYDYQGKTITKFFSDNESVRDINIAYNHAIIHDNKAKLIEYEYISI